jgi:hypothetical protein
VLTVKKGGIRALIYSKDYCFNKAQEAFFLNVGTQAKPIWQSATIPAFHMSVLRDRHSQWLHRQSQAAFIAARPNYQTSRERYARAVGDDGSHRDYS